MKQRWIGRLVKNSVLFSLFSYGIAHAQLEGAAAGFDIGSMIKQMKLNKGDMARMIDQLVQAGQIKPEEAKAAKAQLMQMSDSDMENLKLEAVELYKKKGSDPGKLLDAKTKKALEELKSNAGESELTQKLKALDEGY